MMLISQWNTRFKFENSDTIFSPKLLSWGCDLKLKDNPVLPRNSQKRNPEEVISWLQCKSERISAKVGLWDFTKYRKIAESQKVENKKKSIDT